MPEPELRCPKCNSVIPLTESLAAPLLEASKRRYDAELAKKDDELAREREEMKRRRDTLQEAERALDATIAARLQQESARLQTEEATKARKAFAEDLNERDTKLREAQEEIERKNEKLAEASKQQADFLRKERALEDRARQIDLDIEKRVSAELSSAKEAALRQAREETDLDLRGKNIEIQQLSEQIKSLKQRALQSSQQIKGDAQEMQISERLALKFPHDTVSRVAKGVFGADCSQEVYSSQGRLCGTILWESKNTQTWSDAWLTKLKDNQRTAKADVAIIVSQALPKGVETFELMGEVWVAKPECLIAVAGALRYCLIEMAATRRASEGYQDKAAQIYQYVTSSAFKQRVQAVVETFTVMQADLEAEKRAMRRQWEKREKQLDRMSEATSGMWGDLQAIGGRSVPEIEGLSFEALTSGN